MKRIVQRGCVALIAVMCLAVAGHATTLGFDAITNNSSQNIAIGEAQLSVSVTSYNANQVLFTFYNVGSAACSITDIYFDNGSPAKTFLNMAGLIDKDNGSGGDAGVDFSPLASPNNLPGGNSISPAFKTSSGLSADSDSPVSGNGVNPGEKLGVILNLLSGKNFNSVLAALGSGDLRIGIHVQSFKNGKSESFINKKPGGSMVVPEPTTMGLLAAGLVSLTATRRRRHSA